MFEGFGIGEGFEIDEFNVLLTFNDEVFNIYL